MHISTKLDPARLADLARDPNHRHCHAAQAAHDALRKAQAAHPGLVARAAEPEPVMECAIATAAGSAAWAKKWAAEPAIGVVVMTRDAAAAQAAQVALFGTILSAVQPANVGQRFGYDDAYGHFNAHPADPRTDDDDSLSADDARDMATDHVLSYAESVADWLASECDTPAGRLPLDVSALSAGQVIEGTPATLLAVLMTGDNTQALRALHRLRELAGRAFAAEVAERAKLEVAL